jgi:hypothetical protein
MYETHRNFISDTKNKSKDLIRILVMVLTLVHTKCKRKRWPTQAFWSQILNIFILVTDGCIKQQNKPNIYKQLLRINQYAWEQKS